MSDNFIARKRKWYCDEALKTLTFANEIKFQQPNFVLQHYGKQKKVLLKELYSQVDFLYAKVQQLDFSEMGKLKNEVSHPKEFSDLHEGSTEEGDEILDTLGIQKRKEKMEAQKENKKK